MNAASQTEQLPWTQKDGKEAKWTLALEDGRVLHLYDNTGCPHPRRWGVWIYASASTTRPTTQFPKRYVEYDHVILAVHRWLKKEGATPKV